MKYTVHTLVCEAKQGFEKPVTPLRKASAESFLRRARAEGAAEGQ